MAEPAELTEPNVDLQAQEIILAATQHNPERLRALLRTGSANVQDPETGSTPLHAAIAACEPEETEGTAAKINGRSTTHDQVFEAADKTVRLLLQNGGIWNDLDSNDETPGCIARRLGLTPLYDIMVDAGVRAELLLNRLDGYEELDEADDQTVAERKEDEQTGHVTTSEDDQPSEIVIFGNPPGAAALNAPDTDPHVSDVNGSSYLRSHLTFQHDRLLDEDRNGVMMAWETGIMKRSAQSLVPTTGLRVLNVGHGMGIIDDFFQAKSPASHHIIEAHPAVLEKMRHDGWLNKANVTIHADRWQDVLPKLLEENVMFDAIYFDTFAEDYKALREFFSEYVIGLLDAQGGPDGEGGKWGFFNGLGADRQICYDLVEMDLFEAGFDTEWEELDVPNLDETGEWKGVRRKYWVVEKNKLPICRFIA